MSHGSIKVVAAFEPLDRFIDVLYTSAKRKIRAASQLDDEVLVCRF